MLTDHRPLQILTLTTLVSLGLSTTSSALPVEWQSSINSSIPAVSATSLPSPDPLDLVALEQLDQQSCPSKPCPETVPGLGNVATRLNAPLKQPSLWLYRDLFKPGLILNWLVYPTKKQESARVDFVLSRSIWATMDYLERYAFINAIGAATRRFGYNSRFFNVQYNTQNRLATYTCNFPQDPETCHLVLESIGFNRFH